MNLCMGRKKGKGVLEPEERKRITRVNKNMNRGGVPVDRALVVFLCLRSPEFRMTLTLPPHDATTRSRCLQ